MQPAVLNGSAKMSAFQILVGQPCHFLRSLAYGRFSGRFPKSKCRKCLRRSSVNRENGLKAQIFVTAQDMELGTDLMWSNSKKKVHKIERLELRLPEGQELKEDQWYHLVIAHYQDGSCKQALPSRSNRCEDKSW